jgi:hypothetical protein
MTLATTLAISAGMSFLSDFAGLDGAAGVKMCTGWRSEERTALLGKRQEPDPWAGIRYRPGDAWMNSTCPEAGLWMLYTA